VKFNSKFLIIPLLFLYEMSFILINVIFDVFSIKRYTLFILALYSFFLNGYFDINYLIFLRLLLNQKENEENR
jgi:hypothetical protein